MYIYCRERKVKRRTETGLSGENFVGGLDPGAKAITTAIDGDAAAAPSAVRTDGQASGAAGGGILRWAMMSSPSSPTDGDETRLARPGLWVVAVFLPCLVVGSTAAFVYAFYKDLPAIAVLVGRGSCGLPGGHPSRGRHCLLGLPCSRLRLRLGYQ